MGQQDSGGRTPPIKAAAVALIVSCLASVSQAQTMLKVAAGWGDSFRLGRWTPIFVSVADPQTRSIDLQIHGTYGEKSAAMWIHQTAVVQPRPATYVLLFPINAMPSRIEVIISDQVTGKTLAAQPLQDPASFTPAGQVPARIVAAQDLLIGISGEIGAALRLQSQLNQAGVTAGILDPIRLPSNFAGYDGISLLILAAGDLRDLEGAQQRAILQWVELGGNLLVIPGTLPLPASGPLIESLPCDIGVNQTSPLPSNSAATQPSIFNSRQLSPRRGAIAVPVLDQTGYERRFGLGRIAVIPADISPLQFPDGKTSNDFWHQSLAGLVDIPAIHEVTETEVGPAEEDSLSSGPNAADSVGRGPRESIAIRHVLNMLGAAGATPTMDPRALILTLMGICFLIGPVDSILLARVGHPPRTPTTLIGWAGLLTTIVVFAVNRAVSPGITVRSVRLIDQIDGSAIAATDIVAIDSDRSTTATTSLDETEWWEPANQEARTFGPQRFFDAACREDRAGCRPESLRLVRDEPQAWHGESADLGRAILRAQLSINSGNAGVVNVSGTLTNLSSSTLSDIQVATASGNCRIEKSLPAGASLEVNEPLTNKPITFQGLPDDVADIAPQRADRINNLLNEGFACVECQMPDAAGVKMIPGVNPDARWQILRAAIPLQK